MWLKVAHLSSKDIYFIPVYDVPVVLNVKCHAVACFQSLEYYCYHDQIGRYVKIVHSSLSSDLTNYNEWWRFLKDWLVSFLLDKMKFKILSVRRRIKVWDRTTLMRSIFMRWKRIWQNGSRSVYDIGLHINIYIGKKCWWNEKTLYKVSTM